MDLPLLTKSDEDRLFFFRVAEREECVQQFFLPQGQTPYPEERVERDWVL
jgi:hypothetical protein